MENGKALQELCVKKRIQRGMWLESPCEDNAVYENWDVRNMQEAYRKRSWNFAGVGLRFTTNATEIRGSDADSKQRNQGHARLSYKQMRNKKT